MKKVCLHGHSIYSKDGIAYPDEIFKIMDIAAITDHGTLGSHYYVPEDGKKIIRGIEMYIDMPVEYQPIFKKAREKRGKAHHLTILADGEQGWLSLVRLSAECWNGFYHFPRVTFEKFMDMDLPGIIVLSGCPASVIYKLWESNNLKLAVDVFLRLKEKFRGRFYAEVMPSMDIQYVEFIADVAKNYNVQVVMTQDAHYTSDLFNAWVVYKALDEEAKYDLSYEMSIPDNLLSYYRNSISLAEDINEYTLKFSYKDYDVNNDIYYLRKIAIDRADKYNFDIDYSILDKEIEVIKDIGMSWYMTIIYDIFQIANNLSGGHVTLRGSASSSYLLYLLGMTRFNPLKHGLMFERFMSRDRKELPDVDIDVPASKRDEIIKEIESMGNFVVIHTSTEVNYEERSAKNRYDKFIKSVGGNKVYDNSVIDIMKGRMMSYGTHASGLTLIPKSLSQYVPTRIDNNDNVCIEYSYENCGFLKVDILGQDIMDVIKDCSSGCSVEMSLPFDQSVFYDTVEDCTGVFQLTGKMRRYWRCYALKKKPDYFDVEDYSYVSAVYRPAILESGYFEKIFEFDNSFIPESVRKLLNNGSIVYQEDLLRLLANYIPLENSYSVMKKLAKKDIDGANKILDSLNAKIPTFVLNFIQSFGSYGFNKSHSVSYAYRTYQSAWCRKYVWWKYYPAIIDRENGIDRAWYVMNFCRRHGNVLPPDLKSLKTRVDQNGNLVLGASLIKGFGVAEPMSDDMSVDKYVARLNKKKRDILFESTIYYYLSGDLDKFNVKIASSFLSCPIVSRDEMILNNSLFKSICDSILYNVSSVKEYILWCSEPDEYGKCLCTDGTDVIFLYNVKPGLGKYKINITPLKSKGILLTNQRIVGDNIWQKRQGSTNQAIYET